MYKVTLDLLCIAFIVTYGLDVSGFGNSVREGLASLIKVKPEAIKTKPLFCSLCMTFWIGCIYLLIQHAFYLPHIVSLCLISYLTPVIGDVYRVIRDLITKLTQKLD